MVLYQKYRPKKFSQLVNQEPIRETLLAALKNKRVAHAYLFTGPRGTGKTTVARILARAMNCQKLKQGEPCGRCLNCRESEQHSAVDLIETDAASNRGIDQIRELREKIKFSPIAAQYKVYIIDEVHMLTTEAFNAILKILEEPPSHAIFILATTEPHRVPDTVLSRCQRFDFKPLSISEIANYLKKVARKENYQIENQALLMIAAAAQGSLRDGLGIIEQVAAAAPDKISQEAVQKILGLVESRAIIRLVDLLVDQQTKEALKVVNSLVRKGIRPERIIDSLNEYLRQLLLIKFGLGEEGLQLTKEEQQKAASQAQALTEDQIDRWVNLLLEVKRQPSINLPQLPLEMAVIELTSNPTSQAKSKPKAEAASSLDLTELKKRWPRILAEIRQFNHSLSGILAHCQMKAVKGRRLILVTNHSFYQERIMDLANRQKIEEIMAHCLGQRYRVKCRLQKDLELVSNREKRSTKRLSQQAEKIFNSN